MVDYQSINLSVNLAISNIKIYRIVHLFLIKIYNKKLIKINNKKLIKIKFTSYLFLIIIYCSNSIYFKI
jgi:hypothetical protein